MRTCYENMQNVALKYNNHFKYDNHYKVTFQVKVKIVFSTDFTQMKKINTLLYVQINTLILALYDLFSIWVFVVLNFIF